MKDYSNVSVNEAVNEQLVILLIEEIKKSDAEWAIKRLIGVLNSRSHDASFVEVAGCFLSVKSFKLCVD